MSHAFLICGYGIPLNILNDDNYRRYIAYAINTIYSATRKNPDAVAHIICSGGKTDIRKPYQRTEAHEIIRLYKTLATSPALKPFTRTWKYHPETHALSTLENLLNAKTLIDKKHLAPTRLTIFCEFTRKKRIQHLARKIFGTHIRITVVAIDFDLSPSRYLDPAFLRNKERQSLKHELWAMQSEENLRAHHALCTQKLQFFREHGRQRGTSMHHDAIEQWWRQHISEKK